MLIFSIVCTLNMPEILSYIDLFAGAGGLSEGFIRQGFKPVAHVEMNKHACNTIKTRTTYHWLKENNKANIYYDYLKSEIKNKEELWKNVPEHVINSVINKEISDITDNVNDYIPTYDDFMNTDEVTRIILMQDWYDVDVILKIFDNQASIYFKNAENELNYKLDFLNNEKHEINIKLNELHHKYIKER